MFKCQKKDCDIYLSKAFFPSKIKCPLCQNSLSKIEDEYVKREFVKAINEIKELVALIVPNSTSEKKHIQSLENKISNKDEELISFLPYLIAFPLEKTLLKSITGLRSTY